MSDLISRELSVYNILRHEEHILATGDIDIPKDIIAGVHESSFLRGVEYGMELAKDLVLKQPTAYDKDKVVEEINNIDLQHPCDDCPHLEECDRIQMECSNAHDLCALVTKHYAIEAVRKGGVE